MKFVSLLLPLIFLFIFLSFVPHWTYKFLLLFQEAFHEFLYKDFDK